MPVYKDSKGSWYFKCSINGKQILRRGFSTKSEASKAEVLFKAENQNKKSKVKVIKFYDAVDLYLKYLKENVKPTTLYNRKLCFKKYILPYFRNIDVTKLMWDDFINFRSNLSKENIKDKNRIINFLIAFFNYLDSYFDINISYIKRIQRFKNFSPDVIEDKIVNKPVEFSLLKKYYQASNNYFKFYLLTTYIFGLRISEVRGLHVDSFDLEKNVLRIYKATTCKVGMNKSIDLTPKSSSSKRKYFLSNLYKELLINHIRENNLNNKNRIFYLKKKNIPISETTIRRYLQSIEKEHNLEHITPHGLRHGIASYLYAEGIPWEDIGKYLGHKFNSVTMDTYIDLTKERQLNIINSINKLIIDLKAR